jgi:hypothetical protein
MAASEEHVFLPSFFAKRQFQEIDMSTLLLGSETVACTGNRPYRAAVVDPVA